MLWLAAAAAAAAAARRCRHGCCRCWCCCRCLLQLVLLPVAVVVVALANIIAGALVVVVDIIVVVIVMAGFLKPTYLNMSRSVPWAPSCSEPYDPIRRTTWTYCNTLSNLTKPFTHQQSNRAPTSALTSCACGTPSLGTAAASGFSVKACEEYYDKPQGLKPWVYGFRSRIVAGIYQGCQKPTIIRAARIVVQGEGFDHGFHRFSFFFVVFIVVVVVAR